MEEILVLMITSTSVTMSITNTRKREAKKHKILIFWLSTCNVFLIFNTKLPKGVIA